MIQHFLSAFVAVSKFHGMNMNVLYLAVGQDRCVNPYVILDVEMKMFHVLLYIVNKVLKIFYL
jgi:hypothetical protein